APVPAFPPAELLEPGEALHNVRDVQDRRQPFREHGLFPPCESRAGPDSAAYEPCRGRYVMTKNLTPCGDSMPQNRPISGMAIGGTKSVPCSSTARRAASSVSSTVKYVPQCGLTCSCPGGTGIMPAMSVSPSRKTV